MAPSTSSTRCCCRPRAEPRSTTTLAGAAQAAPASAADARAAQRYSIRRPAASRHAARCHGHARRSASRSDSPPTRAPSQTIIQSVTPRRGTVIRSPRRKSGRVRAVLSTTPRKPPSTATGSTSHTCSPDGVGPMRTLTAWRMQPARRASSACTKRSSPARARAVAASSGSSPGAACTKSGRPSRSSGAVPDPVQAAADTAHSAASAIRNDRMRGNGCRERRIG